MDISRLRMRFAFSAHVRSRFYEAMASKMENGLDRLTVLKTYRDRAVERKGLNSPEASLYGEFTSGIESGASMERVLAPYISPAETMLIEAGEKAGDQVLVLRLAARLTRLRREIRMVVLKGSAEPLVLIAFLYAMLVFIGVYLVPHLAVLSKPSTWQGMAHLLYLLSLFAASAGAWLLPIIMLALFVFTLNRLPYWCGSLRQIFDRRLPPWNIYRIIEGGTWLMSFTALVRSGIGRQEAIAFQSERAKPWLHQRLDAPLTLMREGVDIGKAFQQAGYVFPSQDVIDDIEDHAESQRFDEVLQNVAELWVASSMDRVNSMIKNLRNMVMFAFIVIFMWVMLTTVTLTLNVSSSAGAIRF